MTDSITGDVFIDELAMFLDSDTLMLSGVEHSIEVDLSSDLPLGMMFASESRSDNQSGSSSCNDNGHETAVKTILREKETKRRRVYRQKQKDERNALLCQVQDLTLTLEKAKQAELERNARQEEASKSTSGDDNVCVGKWKTLAVWEWESLCRAQDEQKRLQAAASAKAQLIKDLQKVIYKRIERKSLASNPKLSTTRPSDVVVYEAYLQELDTNYARIDEMFRTLAVSTMKETIGKMHRDSGNRKALNCTMSARIQKNSSQGKVGLSHQDIGRIMAIVDDVLLESQRRKRRHTNP
ncbi:hypothetical protein JG687_00010647 [Phytophthora cactorum]|uniref:Uncharacterized protein n=3 Tax=Phytophthora cactorum TaxID=29920 RepID=A0A8T1U9F7_9STRA|nr:hypothetical protein JG687_00010647 [Phytophthora cactorum]